MGLTGCKTLQPLPEKVEDMSCEQLSRLADQESQKNKLPFYLLQISHPGDWRNISRAETGKSLWIRNRSFRHLRLNKKDYYQAETIAIDMPSKHITHSSLRVSASACRAKSLEGTMTFTNFAKDDPAPFTDKVSFNLKGKADTDRLARILCGYEHIPELDKIEAMAQKWKSCQKTHLIP
ncbi:MAG: hypothetical protein IJ022_07525 [Burkholderiaceae bacterium]|nr:hypothetical protein [Burkholderiaceae bacterium]